MKFKKVLFSLITGLSISSSLHLYSQSGFLDPSFDGDGIVTTPFSNNDASIGAIAIQNDGKIVAGGGVSSTNFALARYNIDGSLDTTFDSDGKVITYIGNSDAFITDLLIQNDGKIVSVGWVNGSLEYNFAITRHKTNGSLDSTFGNNGIVTIPLGTSFGFGVCEAVAIQGDGKILVAGMDYDGINQDNFAVARLNLDGSFDTSFDGDGIVTTSIGSNLEGAFDISVQDDGKIVLAGFTENGSYFEYVLIRYNSDGSLDNSFGLGGIVELSIGTGGICYDMEILSDGKIIVAGHSSNGMNDDVALARFNSDGSLDNSFGNAGTVLTPVGSAADYAYGLAVQPDGKYVVVGERFDSAYPLSFMTIRYNIDGTLDDSFGNNGMLFTLTGSSSCNGHAVIVQNDSKIIVAGYSYDSIQSVFTLIRYYPSDHSNINDIDDTDFELYIYPNPFSTYTTVNIGENIKNGKLTIYNVYGKKLRVFENLSGQSIQISSEGFAEGLYLIELSVNNQVVKTEKLIICD